MNDNQLKTYFFKTIYMEKSLKSYKNLCSCKNSSISNKTKTLYHTYLKKSDTFSSFKPKYT